MRMETREYIESIRMFNDEMGIICGVNLLDGNMREVVSPKSIVGIEEMVGILKNIKEKYETDLMISNQNLVQFEKYLSNLEVNVDSV